MNSPNEELNPSGHAGTEQQVSACGAECGCHTTGRPNKARWLIRAIVLAAAGFMVVRAMNKGDSASPRTSAQAFADPAAALAPACTTESAANPGASAVEAETTVGMTISSFSELNTVAANSDAVFVFLPGKIGNTATPPSSPMKAASRLIEAKGLKCGLFTLKQGASDYDQIAGKISVPGVVAMAKGRGMSAISGEITETKLMQGYVAASSAGGCGPSAGAGCCPK